MPHRLAWTRAKSSNFELTPVDDPLQPSRAARRALSLGAPLPLRFFPKSAWPKVTEGDSEAEGAWMSERTRSESDDTALRSPFAARPALDDTFGDAREIVFEPLIQHLTERRA